MTKRVPRVGDRVILYGNTQTGAISDPPASGIRGKIAYIFAGGNLGWAEFESTQRYEAGYNSLEYTGFGGAVNPGSRFTVHLRQLRFIGRDE